MPRRRVGWPLAGALLLACTSGQTTQPAARVDGELAFQKFGGPLTIGPTPAGLRGTAPEDCAPCHAAIVDEWRASGHAMAWTDPIFQGEYGIEPDKSCRDCHAPQSPGGEPRGVAARDGVGCASCHVRDGHVLGTTGRGAGAHPVAVTPALATAEGCRACHQFPFPPAQPGANFAYAPGAWLQDTHREWSKSQVGTGGIDCQACHMPRVRVPETGETRRSHAFPGMRDPGLLARAVKVTVAARRRGGVVDVDVRLEPGAIGHAFPTGDMFRQAVLRVRTVEADADADERVLKRWFGPLRELGERGETLHDVVEDTRVPAPGAGPPPEYHLSLRSPAAREVAWELELLARSPDSPLMHAPEIPKELLRRTVARGQVKIEVVALRSDAGAP